MIRHISRTNKIHEQVRNYEYSLDVACNPHMRESMIQNARTASSGNREPRTISYCKPREKQS